MNLMSRICQLGTRLLVVSPSRCKWMWFNFLRAKISATIGDIVLQGHIESMSLNHTQAKSSLTLGKC